MDTFELFQRLGLALGIGLLIGLERGWREREGAKGSRTAGIRTYGLAGLLGGISAALLAMIGPVGFGMIFAAFTGAFALFKLRESGDAHDYSVTGVVAAMVTFVLGALAVAGDMSVAAGFGVVATAILAARTTLHGWLRRLTWEELRSGLILLAMSFVALPLLPDHPVDPWNAFNPYEAWLMTVTIAVVSAVGYVAVRVAGEERGLMVAGAAGGLAASTAVTVANARFSKKAPASSLVLVAATMVANGVSVTRGLALASVVRPQLGLALADVMVPVALALFAGGLALHRWAGTHRGKGSVGDIGSPFDLVEVLKFGLLLSVIMVVSTVLSSTYGHAGLLYLAGVSGIADIDAIILSTARLAGQSVSLDGGREAVLVAILSNSVSKTALGFYAGSRQFGLGFAGLMALAWLVGGVAFLFM